MRFPGFEGEWERRFGNEVFDSVSNKKHNSDLPVLAITQEHGAIPRNLIDYNVIVSEKSIESYKVVEKGDFIISLRSFQGGIEYSEYKGICSPAYIVLKPKIQIIDKFFKYFLKTPDYIASLNKNLEGIRDGKMISYKYFSEIALPFPVIKEQSKIASFLSLIDERISTQMKIIEETEKMMKGLSEELFSQSIDFENYTWQEHSLGKLGFTYNGLSGKTKENFGVGKPYIQYKQVFDSSKIDLSKCDFVDINENENQNKVQYGDILFTTSSETLEEIGMASVVLDNVKNTYLNSFCFGFRLYSFDILHPKFARFLFRSKYFRAKVSKLGQGSTRFNISKNQLMKEKVLLPPISIQQKIANLLSIIDEKINLEKSLLLAYQQQKTYLLKNMFV